MQRTETGWVAASDETLKLLVKGEGGRIGLHLESWEMECGVTVPKTSTGTVSFADKDAVNCSHVDQQTTDDIAAGRGILWSRVTGAGVSYDDKLGMRFFF